MNPTDEAALYDGEPESPADMARWHADDLAERVGARLGEEWRADGWPEPVGVRVTAHGRYTQVGRAHHRCPRVVVRGR